MLFEYEKINYENNLPFKVFFVSIARRNAHRHNELELVWCIKGSVNIIVKEENEKSMIPLRENELAVINSNEDHGLVHDDAADNILIAVQMKNEYLRTYYPDIDRTMFQRKIPDGDGLRRIRGDIVDIVWTLDGLMQSEPGPGVFRLLAVYNRLLGDLLEFSGKIALQDAHHDFNDLSMQRLNRVLKFINENYMEKITLGQIAEREHIDIYYLSRFIKNMLGMTFQDYLSRVRLEKAVTLLLDTDDPIAGIAERSGFSDIKYLNKILRQEYRCTASQYRQIYRGKRSMSIDITDKGQQHQPVDYYNCLDVLRQLSSRL